jgi:hypothetical protein
LVSAPVATAQVYVGSDVAAVRQLYSGLIGASSWSGPAGEQIRPLAHRLAEGHRASDYGAFVELHNWHPALTHLTAPALFETRLDEDDCLLAVARERRYADVDAATHDAALPGSVFEAAVDSLLGGDLDGLRRQLGGCIPCPTSLALAAPGHAPPLLPYRGRPGRDGTWPQADRSSPQLSGEDRCEGTESSLPVGSDAPGHDPRHAERGEPVRSFP